jgi:1,3-beta-glucanosyltransferase GAS1
MKNYDTLKEVLASVKPSSTAMASYTPTNKPAHCPSINAWWRASETLPLKPDADLCSCMYRSLSCVPRPGLSPDAYSSIFAMICSKDAKLCDDIRGNTASGTYGRFSMCDSTQKLGRVLDAYYKSNGSVAYACDFQGQAVVTQAAVDPKVCLNAGFSLRTVNVFAIGMSVMVAMLAGAGVVVL